MNYPSKSFDVEEDTTINLARVPDGCACGGICFCEKVLAVAPMPMIAVNSTGAGRLLHQAAATLLLCDQDVIGREADEILAPLQPEKWAEAQSGLARAGQWQGDLIVRGRDGSTRTLELSARRIVDDENEGRFDDIYICRDITESNNRKREICLQEKIATRAEMAGEISHELNNHLSIVLGNLELMGMSIERGKFDTLANKISSVREGITRITKFVEGLMAVQKPESKSDSIGLRPFLQDEIFHFKSTPQFQGIEFACDWGEDEPAIIGDRCRLQQAIYNILLNAADALSAAQVENKKIGVKIAQSLSDNTVSIAISDNGPGMSPEIYQRLFRQFFSTKGPGHGFGLLAVKGAVKSFGGNVSASPGPDGGACFTITLPSQKTPQQSDKSRMVPAQ